MNSDDTVSDSIKDSVKARNPLGRFKSLKTKLSIVIVAAVLMTALTSQLGYYLSWPVWIRPFISAAVALGMVQVLARGMTRPLRRMAAAVEAMTDGHHGQRVAVSGRDEVARLGHSFNQMTEALAETDRHQREFIANASHELRTPVTALRSTLENLVDGVGQPDQETLNRMLARAEHLSQLVNQLLQVSRLDALTDSLKVQSVDIGDLLHSVADEVMTAHPHATIDIKSPIGLKIEAEASGIRQVFVNIVGNAVRFSHPGEAVTVIATQTNGSVGIAVRDTGPGIEPEERAKVFERFWQAGALARTGSGGAGLGLTISKQIVDRHNGTIDVRENEPRGACFVVTLPRESLTEPLPGVRDLADH